MIYYLFKMLLESKCQYLVENFCIYIHKGYKSVVFFSCDITAQLWYLDNGGIIEFWKRLRSVLEILVCLFVCLFVCFLFLFYFYLWLCWVFISVRGLSPVAAIGGHSSSRCAGLSPSRPLPLQSTGSRCAGSAIVAHGLSRSAACGILPDQGSNPCPLHWQADSQPLRHQGSPVYLFLD